MFVFRQASVAFERRLQLANDKGLYCLIHSTSDAIANLFLQAHFSLPGTLHKPELSCRKIGSHSQPDRMSRKAEYQN
jgi:hypothetical protein